MAVDHATVIARTRTWIQTIVIALNLCPFAKKVFNEERIRYVVSDATDADSLLTALAVEMDFLANAPREEAETTVLIHPGVFDDFLDYNDFLDPAESLLAERGHEGVLQIASFHPQYQFGGSRLEDVENHTNRSPYPMLHLLREESVSEVAEDEEFLEQIPERNMETLRKLGVKAMRAKMKEIMGD